jgi:protein-S-isoprenylcysteine O-methyltransferase Ste14
MTGWRVIIFYVVTFGYLVVDFGVLRNKSSPEKGKISLDRWTAFFSYIVIAISFFLTLNCFSRKILLPGYGRRTEAALSIFGLGLGFAGLFLRRAAKMAMGKFFTVRITLFADHRLVTDGIYRRIRHPGYLGLILWCFAIPCLLAYPFGLVTFTFLPAAFFICRSLLEERIMSDRFGEEFTRYKASSYRLIPFLW